MIDEERKLYQDSCEQIKNAIGHTIWDRFCDKKYSYIQNGIVTSQICINTMPQENDHFDYASAIIPLMKVLEHALIQSFYVPYLTYIRENYTPECYIEINELKQKEHVRGLRIKPEDLRKCILFSRNNEYGFCDTNLLKNYCRFTIGSYSYTVGLENEAVVKCDKTAIQYYQNEVFRTNEKDKEILKWIRRLAINLNSLVRLRNVSAHGGKMQSLAEAKQAMADLVTVKKVLFDILFPCL